MTELHNPTVLVVRHGATAFNRGSDETSRLKGTKYDLPLTDKGHEEAKRSADRIAQFPVAALRHSDMLRSAETAEHIERATGVKSQKDDGLDPWDVGYMAGQTRADAKRRIEYYIRNPQKTVPEGESYGSWYGGYEDSLAREMREAESKPLKARVLVTHSCNAAATPSIVDGEEPKFHSEHLEAPGAITKLEKRGGKWRMSALEN